MYFLWLYPYVNCNMPDNKEEGNVLELVTCLFLVTYASIEDSDDPTQTGSLARAFAACIIKV